MIRKDINSDIISKLEIEIARLKKENLITVIREKKQSKFSADTSKFLYDTYHNSLPLGVIEAHEQLIFSERFLSIEEFYFGLNERKNPLSENAILKSISRVKEDYNVDFHVFEFISSRLDFVPHILSDEINSLKNSEFFPCCDDSTVIIKNLIRFYRSIVNSPKEQVNFFLFDLKLNKKLSDLMTVGIINVLEKTLDLITDDKTINTKDKTEVLTKTDTSFKLIWQGQQKELVELISELQDKNWIRQINSGEISKAAKSICKTFDLTGTKRKIDTDERKSFEQSLKGDLIEGNRDYSRVLGKRYVKKFNEILNNKKYR